MSRIRLIILTGLSLPGLLAAGAEWSGYFENRFFLINQKAVFWKQFSEKFSVGDYNRLRLNLKASPSAAVTANLAVDIFSFHGALISPVGTIQPSSGADSKPIRIDPDRIYVDLHFKHFDLSIGKQRAALGVSYVWAPLDVFNRVNLLEPKEEKPGVNAAKLYIPIGKTSSVTAVFSPDHRFTTSTSALRAQTQVWTVDAALTLIHQGDRQQTIYGADLRGETLIGWWIEYGHVAGAAGRHSKLVIGWDYTFPLKTGLYLLNEYYFDGSGERDPGRYDFERLQTGDRFTLARHYFLSMLRFAFNDFWQASFSYIGNWTDGSFILGPTIQYEPFQNGSLIAGGYFPMGNHHGELTSGGRNMVFLWLKIHF